MVSVYTHFYPVPAEEPRVDFYNVSTANREIDFMELSSRQKDATGDDIILDIRVLGLKSDEGRWLPHFLFTYDRRGDTIVVRLFPTSGSRTMSTICLYLSRQTGKATMVCSADQLGCHLAFAVYREAQPKPVPPPPSRWKRIGTALKNWLKPATYP